MMPVYFFLRTFVRSTGNHARNQHAEQDNTELLDLDNAGRKAGGAGLLTCKAFTLIDILVQSASPTQSYCKIRCFCPQVLPLSIQISRLLAIICLDKSRVFSCMSNAWCHTGKVLSEIALT